jgi:hypothetical protein
LSVIHLRELLDQNTLPDNLFGVLFCIVVERPLDTNTLPDNLFDVLFSCQSANIPWRSLLAHAIALHRSLFAVLAACYEVSIWFIVVTVTDNNFCDAGGSFDINTPS